MVIWAFTMEATTDFDQTQFSYIIDAGVDEKRVSVKELYWEDLFRYCKVNKHLKLM